MAEKWHSGISMHKLSVGSGFVGLVFTAGCALIFLLGLPELWYFVAFSAALGIGIAFFIRWVNKRRSERSKPLSILHANEPTENPSAPERNRQRNLFHAHRRFGAVSG